MNMVGFGSQNRMDGIPRMDGGGFGVNGQREVEVDSSPVYRLGSPTINEVRSSYSDSSLSDRSVEEFVVPEELALSRVLDFSSDEDSDTARISYLNTVKFREIEYEGADEFTGEFIVSGKGIAGCLRALDVLGDGCKVKYAMLFGSLIGMGRDPVAQYIGLAKPSGLSKSVFYIPKFNEENFLELVATVLVMLRSVPDTGNFNHIRAGLFLGLARVCGFITYSSNAQFYRTTDWVRIFIGGDVSGIAKGLINLSSFLESNRNLILASKFIFLENLMHGVRYLALTLEFLNSNDNNLEWTQNHRKTFEVMYKFVKLRIEKNPRDKNIEVIKEWIDEWYFEILRSVFCKNKN